ncbi:hypothetical protein T08_8764 [Trichinella sp. T8]|nr:hypothetical protein T08_8764 [Trichinella sp. T8]
MSNHQQHENRMLTFEHLHEPQKGERGGIQPFGYNKRRSICRSTVVSESDPRANGTRCFGLLTSADTGKAASILRSHGANALAMANALTEGRSIQTN